MSNILSVIYFRFLWSLNYFQSDKIDFIVKLGRPRLGQINSLTFIQNIILFRSTFDFSPFWFDHFHSKRPTSFYLFNRTSHESLESKEPQISPKNTLFYPFGRIERKTDETEEIAEIEEEEASQTECELLDAAGELLVTVAMVDPAQTMTHILQILEVFGKIPRLSHSDQISCFLFRSLLTIIN